MFSALTPSPSAQWLTAMPVCLPRVAAASDARNVLEVNVIHPLGKRPRNAAGSWPAMNVLPVSKFIRR